MLKELVTAEAIALMKNFKLKRLCKVAKEKYPEMKEFDTRDNSSMREALWGLGKEKLNDLVENLN